MKLTPEHLEWENEVVETRLTQRHLLALAGKAARGKKTAWMTELANSLREEIATWRYRKQLVPPDIEVSWIIHSQIAWKGMETRPEDLFDDMWETDPLRILEAESEGPETDSPIPAEKILLLKNVLTELHTFGFPISEEVFSDNWSCPVKGNIKNKGGISKGKKTIATESRKAARKTVGKPMGGKKSWDGKKVPTKAKIEKSNILSEFFK